MTETLLEDLLEILENIKNNNYYLYDLDVTKDFTGIFIKSEIEKYLINNFHFCFNCKYVKTVQYDNSVGTIYSTWWNINIEGKIYMFLF